MRRACAALFLDGSGVGAESNQLFYFGLFGREDRLKEGSIELGLIVRITDSQRPKVDTLYGSGHRWDCMKAAKLLELTDSSLPAVFEDSRGLPACY